MAIDFRMVRGLDYKIGHIKRGENQKNLKDKQMR